MPLLQPSFRGRLAAVLRRDRDRPDDRRRRRAVPAARRGGSFKLDSGLAQAQKTANAIYAQDRERGEDRAGPVHAVAGPGDGDRQEPGGARARAARDAAHAQTGAEWVKLTVPFGRSRPVTTRRSPRRRPNCRTQAAARSARSRCRRRPRTSTPPTRRAWRSCRCASIAAANRWRRRCPRRSDVVMPTEPGADVTIGNADYRTTFFRADEPSPPKVVVRLLGRVPEHDTDATIVVVGLLVGFLALALVFAVIVSRTLSSRSSGCSYAAQRLGRGDFSVSDPRRRQRRVRRARQGVQLDGAPARGTPGGPAARSAPACRRRSAASASRSPAASTASACSRSSCRPRSTAWAPRRAARRCAGVPTRRWRRSLTPATPTPSTARCTPPRRP